MTIKSTTTYNMKIMSEYNNSQMKGKIPVFIITAAIVIAGLVMSIMGIIETKKWAFGLILIAFVVIAVFQVLLYTIIPKILYKRALSNGFTANYIFDDFGIHTDTIQGNISDHSDDPWETVTKIKETVSCYLIYIEKSSIFIVGKNSFTEGTCEDAVSLFKEKAPKACKNI